MKRSFMMVIKSRFKTPKIDNKIANNINFEIHMHQLKLYILLK